ncbi:hypothetical protein BH11PAT1_BH11PAT1_4610 [soil metagenome]
MSSNRFKGAIWTNHALNRLGERGLTQEMAGETFQYPDRRITGKNPGTHEYQRKYQNSLVTVIAKQNEKGEWLIISCWIDPPLYGTKDYQKKQDYIASRKAGVWGKLWYTIKRQLFG